MLLNFKIYKNTLFAVLPTNTLLLRNSVVRTKKKFCEVRVNEILTGIRLLLNETAFDRERLHILNNMSLENCRIHDPTGIYKYDKNEIIGIDDDDVIPERKSYGKVAIKACY